MKKVALKGIIPATVLPMTRAFQPDYPALKRYMSWLIDQGIHGLAINVDTGEGPHLYPAERLKVLETVATLVKGRIPVISGLGAPFTHQAVGAAKDLKSAGADALLVFPPSAFRGHPLPAEIPVNYYRAVGEGAHIPLVLFQLQEALGGVEFSDDVMVQIAKLDCVIAMKEATFDARRFKDTVARMQQAKADITILTGNDNFIYESFLLGAEGALIGFGTLIPRMQVDMYEAHLNGERHRAAQLGRLVQHLADVIFAPPVRDYRVRLKEALTMQKVIPASHIRPPLLPVSSEEKTKIKKALQHVGAL